MLAGRYPSEEFAELRPRITWDRVAGLLRGREGARRLAVTNAGTIPDRGLFGVHLVDGGGRVGELDEEMVYEARAGQTFLLGASTWRIEEITRDRVLVSPAPGVPGLVPFWKGEGVGRPYELGRGDRPHGPGARRASTTTAPASGSSASTSSTSAPPENLLTFLREQERRPARSPPTGLIVVERFRDEIGDWRLCILTPFGAPRARAVGTRAGRAPARVARARGQLDLVGRRDRAPPARRRRSAAARRELLVGPDELEELVVAELGGTALFGARFRENAARALLIPRRRPGQRTPLWQQRLKAQGLLQVARRYPDFPVVLETYRECLQDVFDLPALSGLLGGAAAAAHRPRRGRDAERLAVRLVAPLRLRRDLHVRGRHAARRAARAGARARPRPPQGAARPGGAPRPDRPGGARAGRGGASRRRRERRRAPRPPPAARRPARPASSTRRSLPPLEAERRAVRVRVGGEERLIAAEDAGRYRDALGRDAARPAFRTPISRAARTRSAGSSAASRAGAGRSRPTEAARAVRARARARRGGACSGGARPRPGRAAARRDRARVVRSGRPPAAAPREPRRACARRSSRSSRARSAGSCPAGKGIDRRATLREALVPLQGVSLPVALWESDVLPRRVPGYQPAQLDQLTRVRARSSGSAPASSGSPSTSARTRRPSGARPRCLRRRRRPTRRSARRSRAARCFWFDLVRETGLEAEAALPALWDLVWAGEVTNDAWQPLAREPPLPGARGAEQRPRRFSRCARGRDHGDAGTLVVDRRALRRRARSPGARRAPARAPGDRHARRRSRRRDSGRLRARLSGAAQAGDARGLPPRLLRRGPRRRPVRASGCGRASARAARRGDRARPRRRRSRSAVRRGRCPGRSAPARALPAWPGAYVVLLGGEPALFVERGGRSLVPLRDPEEAWLRPALAALVEHARRTG